MSFRPWYPWYPGDYRAKTAQLTTEQDGAYRRLLDEIYLTRRPLPDDDHTLTILAGCSRQKWPTIRSAIERYFLIENGTWRNARAEEVMATQSQLNQSFSDRGKSGANKRWGKLPTDSLANGPANSLATTQNIARPMAYSKTNNQKDLELPKSGPLGGNGKGQTQHPDDLPVNVKTLNPPDIEHNRAIAQALAEGNTDEAQRLRESP